MQLVQLVEGVTLARKENCSTTINALKIVQLEHSRMELIVLIVIAHVLHVHRKILAMLAEMVICYIIKHALKVVQKDLSKIMTSALNVANFVLLVYPLINVVSAAMVTCSVETGAMMCAQMEHLLSMEDASIVNRNVTFAHHRENV